jgi:hypothetical protein
MTATAKMLRKSEVQTRWHVEANGKSYSVTTYPESQLMFIETATGRQVSMLQARKLVPCFRAAIQNVERAYDTLSDLRA